MRQRQLRFRWKTEGRRQNIGKAKTERVFKSSESYRERQRAYRLRKKDKSGIESSNLWLSRHIFQPRICSFCGSYFESIYPEQKRCFGCQKRRAHESGQIKHRCMAYGCPYEPGITLKTLIARDGLFCKLGNHPIIGSGLAKDLPTIEHIIPVSAVDSPGHVWSNVQIACRSHNSSKQAYGFKLKPTPVYSSTPVFEDKFCENCNKLIPKPITAVGGPRGFYPTKRYCSPRCRRSVQEKRALQRYRATLSCFTCGAALPPRRAKYCSAACSNKSWAFDRAKIRGWSPPSDKELKVCKGCGTNILYKDGDKRYRSRKFCSYKCYQSKS
jgi:hypothetical protein